MKGGTLIRSANNQILDEFEAVIIQPPVLRELRVDSMLGTVETQKDQTTASPVPVLMSRALMLAQLLGHSDVRVTMRYVRTVEESKRAAVDAVQLHSRKNVHVLATWPKQPPLPAAVNG